MIYYCVETIRVAQLDDCAAIAHVHVESWRTTYKDLVPVEHHPSHDQRLRMWQQVLSTPAREGVTFVAVNEQGRVVGFVDSHGPWFLNRGLQKPRGL